MIRRMMMETSEQVREDPAMADILEAVKTQSICRPWRP